MFQLHVSEQILRSKSRDTTVFEVSPQAQAVICLTLSIEVNKALQELAGPGTKGVVNMLVRVELTSVDSYDFVAPNEGRASSSMALEDSFKSEGMS